MPKKPKKKKEEGNAIRGERFFRSLCGVCHNTDSHGIGPGLRGVYDAYIATAEGFTYSSSL